MILSPEMASRACSCTSCLLPLFLVGRCLGGCLVLQSGELEDNRQSANRANMSHESFICHVILHAGVLYVRLGIRQ